MIKLVKDGAIYASVPVNYSPIATIMTDSNDKLLTDGAETVTTLKVNGVAVDLSEYTISSVDSNAAVVEIVENNIQITPLQPGQAIFRVYKDNKYAIDNNTLTALTLLIAESNPKEKEVIIDLVINFLHNE